MKRRNHRLTRRPLALPALAARAHHGWSSFDQDRADLPEGQVVRPRWQNPHAELISKCRPA